jgi:hypothetical protein
MLTAGELGKRVPAPAIIEESQFRELFCKAFRSLQSICTYTISVQRAYPHTPITSYARRKRAQATDAYSTSNRYRSRRAQGYTLDATDALNCGAVTLGSVFDLPLSFLS